MLRRMIIGPHVGRAGVQVKSQQVSGQAAILACIAGTRQRGCLDDLERVGTREGGKGAPCA